MREPIDEELQKLIANPDLDHLEQAQNGNLTPLADHVESGGTLHSDTRIWLAKYLRDELPAKPSGRKRTSSKKLDDYRIWRRVLKEMPTVNNQKNKAFEVVGADMKIPTGTVRAAFERMELRFDK